MITPQRPPLRELIDVAIERLQRGEPVTHVEVDLHLRGLEPDEVRAVIWSAVDRQWQEQHARRATRVAAAYEQLRRGDPPDLVEGRLLAEGAPPHEAHRVVAEACRAVQRAERRAAQAAEAAEAEEENATMTPAAGAEVGWVCVPDWLVVAVYAVVLVGLNARLAGALGVHPALPFAVGMAPFALLKAARTAAAWRRDGETHAAAGHAAAGHADAARGRAKATSCP